MAKKKNNKIPLEELETFREFLVSPKRIKIRDFFNSVLTKCGDSENGIDFTFNRSTRRKIEKAARKLNTARDNSVQRESVWEDNRRSNYISNAIRNSIKLVPMHLLVLKSCYEVARKRQDNLFANLLKFFIDRGYEYLHIDGGNRCDDIWDFFNNEVYITPGLFEFLPKDGEKYGHQIAVQETDVNCEKLETKFPELYNKLLGNHINVHLYYDLSQLERSDWFGILNDGVSLNPAEKRNRLLSNLCRCIREELNKDFKKLIIESGCLTQKESERYGACEYLARLNHLSSTLNEENPTLLIEGVDEDETVKIRKRAFNDCPVWPSHTEMDKDYISDSVCDKFFTSFDNFFRNTYVPLLKIIKGMGEGKDKKPFQKNVMVDFFYLVYYIHKFNYKIIKDKRKDFVNVFNRWSIAMIANTDRDFFVNKNDVTFRKWFQMYSGNSPENLCNRFPTMVNELIPELIKTGHIIKIDPKVGFSRVDKAKMAVKQGLTLSDNPKDSLGEDIEASELWDGTINQGDHQHPRSLGGPTIVDNGSMETAKYNRFKSDKLPEEVS